MATARLASGTRCGRPLTLPCTVRFILAAGIVHSAQPFRPNYGQHHIALAGSLAHDSAKIMAARNRIHVHEDMVQTKMRGQLAMDGRGLERRVAAAI